MNAYTTNESQKQKRNATVHEEALGVLLKDCTLLKEYRHQLKSEMFYEYAFIYKSMIKLDNDNILNFKNLAFEHRDQLETLQTLREYVISTQMLPQLINKMKKNLLQENITLLVDNITNDDPDDALQKLRDGIDKLSSTESDGLNDPEQDFEEWYNNFVEIVDDPTKANGLFTGINDLDNITTGFHRHDLIVVGARTSIGKSAFMIEMVLRLTKAGYKCAIYSLEMTKKQIYFRMMANLLNHELKRFRKGDFPKNRLHEIKQQKEFLSNIYVDDSRGISSEYIADSMRQIKRSKGLDFVVVDYLQDVKEKGEQNDNQGSALSRICRNLRKAAKDCNTSVMALSQVTREVEKRDNKRPNSSDLAGSTGIETSADVIAMLYRDDYYNEQSDDKNVLEVNFTKQRNGELGTVKLFYDRDRQKITPLANRYDFR